MRYPSLRRLLTVVVASTVLALGVVNASEYPAEAVTPTGVCEFDESDALTTTGPCIAVSKSTDIDPRGETITVRGFNFTPNPPATTSFRAPLVNTFGGVYISVGDFGDVWQPSVGADRATRSADASFWAVHPDDLTGTYVDRTGNTVPYDLTSPQFGGVGIAVDPTTGNFTATFTVDVEMDGDNFGVYTYAGGSAVYAPFELSVPLTFLPSKAPRIAIATNPAQPLPDQPFSLEVLVNPDAADGTLTLSGDGVTSQTKTLEAGVASFSVPATPGGLYAWKVAYTPTEPLLYDARTLSFSLAIDDGTGEALTITEPTESGFLRWGVKSTFRSYVTGSIAKGTITTTEAGRTGSEFLFGQSQPVLDTATWSQVAYRGAVTFRGHGGLMDVTLANPRISKVDDRSATLSVDYEGSRVTIARLDLARASQSESNGFLSYQNAPATLLSTGTRVFSFQGSSFYSAGETLDPVSFSVGSVATPITDTVVDSYEAPEPEFTEESALFADLATTEGACTIADASLTWGFKESFRAYLSGAIAKGDWEVAEGAQYETPTFQFPHQSGTISLENWRGLLRFGGLVNFSGHDGLLDVSVSNPVIGIESEAQATLYLTFEGETMDGEPTSAADIPFARIDLSEASVTREGLQLVVTEAPAYLTAEGARALGTYEARDPMDPVSFTVLTGLDCATAASTPVPPQELSSQTALPDTATSPALNLAVASLAGLVGIGLGVAGVSVGRRLWTRA